jgi:hypothetical protein
LETLRLQSQSELGHLRLLLQQRNQNISSSEKIFVEEFHSKLLERAEDLQRALDHQTKEKEELRKKYEKRISELTLKFDELESFFNKEYSRKLKERDEESDLLRTEYADLKKEVSRKDRKIESLLKIAPRSRDTSQRRDESEAPTSHYSFANSGGFYKLDRRALDCSDSQTGGTSDLEKLVPHTVTAGSEKKINMTRSPSLEKFSAFSSNKKVRGNSAFSFSSLPRYEKVAVPERLLSEAKSPEQFSSLLYRGY